MCLSLLFKKCWIWLSSNLYLRVLAHQMRFLLFTHYGLLSLAFISPIMWWKDPRGECYSWNIFDLHCACWLISLWYFLVSWCCWFLFSSRLFLPQLAVLLRNEQVGSQQSFESRGIREVEEEADETWLSRYGPLVFRVERIFVICFLNFLCLGSSCLWKTNFPSYYS